VARTLKHSEVSELALQLLKTRRPVQPLPSRYHLLERTVGCSDVFGPGGVAAARIPVGHVGWWRWAPAALEHFGMPDPPVQRLALELGCLVPPLDEVDRHIARGRPFDAGVDIVPRHARATAPHDLARAELLVGLEVALRCVLERIDVVESVIVGVPPTLGHVD